MLAIKSSRAQKDQTLKITQKIIDAALRVVKPSILRDMTIEIPQVRYSDIGGYSKLKQKIQQSVEWPLKHAHSFQKLNIKPPKGVLLYGPPGCCKTMIARAVANESNANFISVKVIFYSKFKKKFLVVIFYPFAQASPIFKTLV